MEQTLGKRISELRKQKGLTQEELASKFGVSPQAVSKWECDTSCPDIMMLPQLAEILGITVDELLSGKKEPEVKFNESVTPKDIDKMMLKIRVNSKDGDKVNVNLPITLIKVVLQSGLIKDKTNGISIIGGSTFENIDFEQIIRLVELGVMGKLVEVNSANGDTVEVFVE